MNEELDKKLCETYPKIFRDRHADKRMTCMCWGFSCGDGWYNLIDTLCSSLQWDTDKNDYPQVIADQVKEKFGELRFHYHTERGDVSVDVFSYDARKRGIIEGKIDFACHMSGNICEECGSTNNVKNEPLNGWYKTLCEGCKETSPK